MKNQIQPVLLMTFLVLGMQLPAQSFTYSPALQTWKSNSSDMLCNRGNVLEARIVEERPLSSGNENEVTVVFEIRKKDRTPFQSAGRVSVDSRALNRCPGSVNTGQFTEVGSATYNAGASVVTCRANIQVGNCQNKRFYVYAVANQTNTFFYTGPFDVQNPKSLTIFPVPNVAVTERANTFSIQVSACSNWTLSESIPWVTPSLTQGNGGGNPSTVNLNIATNTTSLERVGTLRFATGGSIRDIQIRQRAGGVPGCGSAPLLALNTVTNSSTVNGTDIVDTYAIQGNSQSGLTANEKVFRIQHPGGVMGIRLTTSVSTLKFIVLNGCGSNNGVFAGSPGPTITRNLPAGNYTVVVDGLSGTGGPFSLTYTRPN